MGKTTLTWEYDGLVGEGFKIYRADSPMDPENLPLPIATVGVEDREYADETVVGDETYYYRVASYLGDTERLSVEIEHIAEESDPYWDKVVSLLHFDDAGYPWKDETGRVWTQIGSATVDAGGGLYGGAFSKLGGLTGGARTASFVEGGPFTVEGWIFIPEYVNSGIISVLSQRQTSSGSLVTPRWEMVVRTSAAAPTPDDFYIAGYNQSQSPENLFGDTPVPKQTWQHIAWSFDGGTIRLFLHGKKVAEASRTYEFRSNTMAALGYFSSTDPAERKVDVKLDEFRVTNGIARYTEDFTPPTGPFPNY